MEKYRKIYGHMSPPKWFGKKENEAVKRMKKNFPELPIQSIVEKIAKQFDKIKDN